MEKCSGVPSGFPFRGIVGAAVQRVASGPLAVMPTYGTMLLPPAGWPNLGAAVRYILTLSDPHGFRELGTGSGEGGVVYGYGCGFSTAYWDGHGNSANFMRTEPGVGSMRMDMYAPNTHKPTVRRRAGLLWVV
ncbi:hypothetical protein JB92DRAFT_3095464 [Gautieria morchelliformis]|nr:hypothetical protein JB92DRAFT_3095464 [Gautieria morchelliformis]